MTVVRRIARPMLAAIFVTSGLDSLRHPAERAKAAAPLVKALSGPLRMPDDPEMMVRANGATMLVAGTLLGLGRFPRIASLALAGALIPTTYAAHNFWTIEDPALRAQQKVHFLKNVGLLGGVLLATKHVRTEARRQAALTKREARHAAKSARRFAKSALD
jgi:putative oxidoreductase